MVALFFNNFLPSNIGGDVVRIGDTAKQAGSKTRRHHRPRRPASDCRPDSWRRSGPRWPRASVKNEPCRPGHLWTLLGGAIAAATVAIWMPQVATLLHHEDAAPGVGGERIER
jgi:hypothetical protein